MKKNNRQELGWALGLMLLPVLYAVWAYQKLPDSLAIHFDLSGKGNAFLPKFIVVSALPIAMNSKVILQPDLPVPLIELTLSLHL